MWRQGVSSGIKAFLVHRGRFFTQEMPRAKIIAPGKVQVFTIYTRISQIESWLIPYKYVIICEIIHVLSGFHPFSSFFNTSSMFAEAPEDGRAGKVPDRRLQRTRSQADFRFHKGLRDVNRFVSLPSAVLKGQS